MTPKGGHAHLQWTLTYVRILDSADFTGVQRASAHLMRQQKQQQLHCWPQLRLQQQLIRHLEAGTESSENGIYFLDVTVDQCHDITG